MNTLENDVKFKCSALLLYKMKMRGLKINALIDLT